MVREAGGALLESVELRDEFRGQKMGEGRKGWTFRLTFRSPERTLTSEEAQECAGGHRPGPARPLRGRAPRLTEAAAAEPW